MNKDNAKDYLPLVQALAEGKEIQMKNGAGIWTSYRDMDFCLIASEYRIKPEPDTVFVVFTRGGRFYDTLRDERHANEFARRINGSCKKFVEVIE